MHAKQNRLHSFLFTAAVIFTALFITVAFEVSAAEEYTAPVITLNHGEESYISDVLPDGYVDVEYGMLKIGNEMKKVAVNLSGCYKYSVSVEGALPPGLELKQIKTSDTSTYNITGTSTAAGAYSFDLVVTGYDEKNQTVGVTRKQLAMTVLDDLKYDGAAQQKSDFAKKTMYVGTDIGTVDLARYISGGRAPYKFELSSGSSLPRGLNLASDGKITGIPQETATSSSYPFQIDVTDANGRSLSGIQYLYVYYANIELPAPTVSVPDGTEFIGQKGFTVTLAETYLDDSYNIRLYYDVNGTTQYPTGTHFLPGTILTEFGKDTESGDTITLRLVANRWGTYSSITAVTYTSVDLPDAPTASHVSGQFAYAFPLKLSCATLGADIYYSVNGEAEKLYKGEYIPISDDTTIAARAGFENDGEMYYGESAVFTYTKIDSVCVSGTIKSHSEDAAVVTLVKDYESQSVIVNGSSFITPSVLPGVYTLRVDKPGHVTRNYDVTIGSGGLSGFEVSLNLEGDINQDGIVNVGDLQLLYRHVNANGNIIKDSYQLETADINGNETVNSDDCRALQNKLLQN